MSLRLRLLLATALIALMALIGADIATYQLLQSSLYHQLDTSLEYSHRPVEASISADDDGPPPVPDGRGPMCPNFGSEMVTTAGLTPGTVVEVRTTRGKLLYHCATTELGPHESGLPALPATVTGFSTVTATSTEPAAYLTAASPSGRQFRVRVSVLGGGPAKGDELAVGMPLTETINVLHTLRDLELVVTAVVVVVAIGLGFWLVWVGLLPLHAVEQTADAIADGRLTERVPGDGARTEVGRVARALNVMLGRIEDAFAERDRTEADLRASEERMRQFVGDASHELRTPLAAVTAYAELFDRGAADRPEDLERVLHGIQAEAGRMRHLVEDLLLLAHLDEGRPLTRQPLDVVDLAADAVETARTVGPAWPVALMADGPVEAVVDGPRLRQVLDNLLGNVRLHTPPGTRATVTVSGAGDTVVIDVADGGPGLRPEDAQRVFERFFRADPSRSRAHGGAGLGLAIVDSIVRAHGGTVTVGVSPSGGAQFTVRLPREEPAPTRGGDARATSAAPRPAPTDVSAA